MRYPNVMIETPASTLYLLRHAHSTTALPGQGDHERPLSARGRDAALAIGPEIRRAGYAIDTVVCSTATRTAETLAAIRPHLPPDTRIESSDALYAHGIEAYLAAASEHGRARGLLLIGHNPMIEEFALSLAGSGDREARQTLAEGFPTAGLAVLEFATGLADIGPGTGRLSRLLHPRELGS